MTQSLKVLSHAELFRAFPNTAVRGFTKTLDTLSHQAFAAYDGIIVGDLEFKRWFMDRPGMSKDSCFVTVCDGEIVSSMFVTVCRMQLMRQTMEVGIIDSVMTHPDYRRNGYAKAMLKKAIEYMQKQNLDLSLLYTVPDSMPFQFYTSLGFKEYIRVEYLRKSDLDGIVGELHSYSSEIPPSVSLNSFLNKTYAGTDGYLPISDELWEWRRNRRPRSVPVCVFIDTNHTGGNHIGGTFAAGTAFIRSQREKQKMTLLNDIAVIDRVLSGCMVIEMLSAIETGSPVNLLCAGTNHVEKQAFTEAGFLTISEESGMIFAFSERAQTAVESPPRHWYTVSESVIGI